MRFGKEIQEVLRRGNGELNRPFLPNHQRCSALDRIPGEESVTNLAANGEVLTNKATRRLRGDRQPVHRIRTAAAQLDRRARWRPYRASCRCPMRQRILHRTAARVPPSTRRATGQVPQDRGPRSQAEGRSALRRSGHRHRRAEPQPIPLRLVCCCAAGQGLGAGAARRKRARHEGRGMVEHARLAAGFAYVGYI
jgi:hypothetical protein